MSGVDIPKEQRMTNGHACVSCMNTVVLSFDHLQKQIQQLQEEKLKLQMQLDKILKEQKALEEKLAQLKGEQ